MGAMGDMSNMGDMGDSLVIDRWRSRYRLPTGHAPLRRRLDGVLAELIDGALVRAVEAAGLGAHEIVCVRRLHASVDLRLRLGDAALAAAWSAAIVTALRSAVHGPVAPDEPGAAPVLRYRSLAEVWLDCADGVARGDLQRAWAWQQAGVWPPTAADRAPAARLVAALQQAPQFIVPLLGALARRGTWAALAAQLQAAHWQQLAQAAASAHGLDRQLVEWALAGPPALSDGTAGRPRAAVASAAELAVLRAAVRADPGAAAAVAVIGALVADPALPRRSEAALLRQLRHWQQALADPPEPAPVPAPTPAASSPGRVAAAPEVGAGAPAAGAPQHAAPAPGPVVHELPADHAWAAPRHAAHTAWGGLLLLLNLVEAAGLLDERPALADKPLAWLLHRVARQLLPLAGDDPAALAFAGLAPEAPAPEGEPKAAEHAAVVAAADALLAALRQQLDEPETPRAELLQRVARRDAEIVASPGWIAVQFGLSSTDTALRRAGLDLDPGWLPWLGAVVRFSYV
jgi:hypothetical protein